jgi:putative flippase GtrA
MRTTKPLEKLLVALRSVGVGGAATLLDLGLLALLVDALGVAPRLASPIALLCGVICQFFGNKLVAFRDRSPRWAEQALRFAGVEVLGFAANLWLFDVAVRAIPLPLLALRLATTSLVYFALCLPLWSLIFRPTTEEAST